MSPAKFSLHRFVRLVQRTKDEIDPDKLTYEVIVALKDAPQEDQDAALEQAVRSFVQHVLNNIRRTRDFPGDQVTSGTQRGAVAGSLNSARSWKTRNAAEYWRGELELPYPLYDGANTWVRFGDLTVEALEHSATYHHTLAVTNQKRAEEAREWARLLREHRVLTIRELPESVLRERLNAAGAA